MSSFVFGLRDIDKTKLATAGGKGANLGELTRIEGIHIPDGFCISTEAFKRIVGETSSIHEYQHAGSDEQKWQSDERKQKADVNGRRVVMRWTR